MNVYIAFGTIEYLSKIKKNNLAECMLFMHDGESAVLMHETKGTTIFKEPKKYEIIDKRGSICSDGGFAVFTYISVTDEGKPLFEQQFKELSRFIESHSGFVALRVLRPLFKNTYIIFTLWETEQDFNKWEQNEAFANHYKKALGMSDKLIFPSPPRVKKYYIVKDEKE